MPKQLISPELKKYLAVKNRGKQTLRYYTDMSERFTKTMRKKEAAENGIPPHLIDRFLQLEDEVAKTNAKLQATLRLLANMVRHIEIGTPLQGTETWFNIKTWLFKHANNQEEKTAKHRSKRGTST